VLPQFLCGTGGRFINPVSDDNFSAFLTEPSCGRPANTLTRARNYADLFLKSARPGGAGIEFVGHHFLPLR
jgi:hypothetical protein